MIRRLAALVCALAALLVIGCGDDDKASTGTTAAVDPNKPVTLTVWDWGVPDPKAMKELDKQYMARHPNVTIKRVAHPFANIQTVLRAAIAARKGPDVFTSYASPFIQDFENGILPVNDMQTPEQAEKLAGWEYITDPDGNILGVPAGGGGTQMYYNKALYRKAGLDPEAPARTWDELLEQCDALKAAGITPIGAGWKDGYYAEWALMQLAHQYQTDEELAQAVNNQDWTSPALDRGFQLLNQLWERGCFTPNSEAIPLFPNAIDEFKAGKSAIFFGLPTSNIHWGEFRETKWGREDLGTMLAPLVPDSLWTEQRAHFAPGHAYAVTKWSENPEVAYDYISFITEASSQDQLFEAVGSFSNHADSNPVTDDPVGQQVIDWSRSADPYAGQILLIRAPVETLLVKFVPAIVTGRQTYPEIQDQIVAEHERATGR